MFEEIKNNILENIRNGINSQDLTHLAQICDIKNYQNKVLNENDIKQIVDTSFREILQELTKDESEMMNFEAFKNFINYSILAAREEICSGNLPVMLLTDLFDCHTLDECEILFNLVEERVDVWKEEKFFKNVKNQLLRSCNDLLRRLSRSKNTVFCGRILVFLARFFPFFERSGLNLISEFNYENVTTFSVQDESFPGAESINNNETLEEGEIKQEAPTGFQVDYNFYRKFWQLQDYFRNPPICYTRTNWKQFQTFSNDILTAFATYKLDPGSYSNFQGLGIGQSEDYLYFAKYLTSQKLLELQLSDSNFRRYILVQFLILFQYLTGSIRFKNESHVLNEEQNNWIKEITDKVYTLFEQTPPNGKEFGKCIENILKREEYWSNWKNEGCPEIKEINENCNIKATKKKKLGDQLKQAEEKNRIIIGNEELNRLWNLFPDNWEACKSKKRVYTPTIEKYFENVLNSSKEQKEKFCSDSDLTWRALRLLSLKSPHFFTPSNQMVKSVSNYLESVIDKLSKDLPQKNTAHDIAIDDAEDISDDELLKNVDDTNLGNSNETQQNQDVNMDEDGEKEIPTANGV